MSNSLWQIAFGPYALIVDRRTLRFDLRDTKADIVWAESLPLGWIELENRETGETARHEFGDCKIISVSEKAGAQGKRILFGLDAPGPVPIDVYVICTEREIQLTVEASRDGKTHRVTGFGLVPGLVSVPDDSASYLVLPSGEGSGILARDVPNHETLAERKVSDSALRYPIWQANGVYMPFVGAVRAKVGAESVAAAPAGSLGLITDSAYGAFVLSRQSDGGVTLDTEYERDPERRRLDVRIVVLPDENHVGVARAYRDKVIGEKNHVTLRRKIRERPIVDRLIGAAWSVNISSNASKTPARKSYLPDDTVLWGEARNVIQIVEVQTEDFSGALDAQTATSTVALQLAEQVQEADITSWEHIENQTQRLTEAQQDYPVGVGLQRAGDWEAIASDFSLSSASILWSFFLPLRSVVYHDCLIFPERWVGQENEEENRFLTALLHLSPGIFRLGAYYLVQQEDKKAIEDALIAGQPQRIAAFSLLFQLHRLTFTAFLTSHRFLTPDALVEEAVYSDKTRIVTNRSDASAYETPELHLPPGGFWVRHAQMEAHDALRVGEQTFGTRVFRIRRALDGKPLEQSGDIETLEFKV